LERNGTLENGNVKHLDFVALMAYATVVGDNTATTASAAGTPAKAKENILSLLNAVAFSFTSANCVEWSSTTIYSSSFVKYWQ
jgi:hypothetical protein